MRTIGLVFPDGEAREAVYTCPTCGKEYKSESALLRHIEDKHSEPDREA